MCSLNIGSWNIDCYQLLSVECRLSSGGQVVLVSCLGWDSSRNEGRKIKLTVESVRQADLLVVGL